MDLSKIKQDGLEASGRYYSRYRGYVEKRNDPDKRGRLIVRVPQIYGNDIHEYWAVPAGLMVGTNNGIAYIPQKGDRVWVTFDHGDARYPMWEHGDWLEGEEIAGLYKDNGEPDNIVVRHPRGCSIVLDDTGISLVKGSVKISLGTLDGSAEPAVLGDKNADALTEIKDKLDALYQILLTEFVTDATIASSMGFTAWAAAVTALQAYSTATITPKIAATKSTHVTLD